jgi:hypothetical protein
MTDTEPFAEKDKTQVRPQDRMSGADPPPDETAPPESPLHQCGCQQTVIVAMIAVPMM